MQANDLAFRILGVGVSLERRGGVCAIGVLDVRNIVVPVASGENWDAAMDALLRNQVAASKRFQELHKELQPRRAGC